MKKILAAGCCIIALQTFSQKKPANGSNSPDGGRVLIKAIAVIVNNEANRKLPPKQIDIPNVGSPKL